MRFSPVKIPTRIITSHRLCGLCTLLILIVMLSGCASRQAYVHDSRDSFEGFNRTMFQVHQSVDFFAITPVADAYGKLVPDFIVKRIVNFYANLGDVSNAANNLLQGNVAKSLNDLMRLFINTTFGILGLFDVASKIGLEKHDEDFGKTLASWGINAGSYLVIPIIGPSTFRDFPGVLVDYFLFNPIAYLDSSRLRITLLLINAVDKRWAFSTQEEIIRSWSPDFYSGLRNYYLARRLHATDLTDEADDDLYEEIEDDNE